MVKISIVASWYVQVKRFGSKMTTIFRRALCSQLQVRSSRNFRFRAEMEAEAFDSSETTTANYRVKGSERTFGRVAKLL